MNAEKLQRIRVFLCNETQYMAMSTEKTLVNAMCNTYKFLSLGNNTHSCISHTIHKYNNYVITLVCVAARVTPALVDDHCYIFISVKQKNRF